MNKKNLISGAVILAYAVFYFASSFSISIFKGAGATAINSATVPRIWGILLILLSGALIIRELPAKKKNRSAAETDGNVTAGKTLPFPVIGTIALLIFYAVAISRLGFTVTTVVYLILQIPLLTPRQNRRYVFSTVFAVLFTLVINWLFVNVLGVPLPAGRLW